MNIHDLIHALAVSRKTTPDAIRLETMLLINSMTFPCDKFKTKPTVEKYFTKMASTLRKELDAEKQIKEARLENYFSSKDMDNFQIAEYLLEESQKMIDSKGFGAFNLARVVNTVNPKTPYTIVSKIVEYVRWINMENLYPLAAELQGTTVFEIEAQLKGIETGEFNPKAYSNFIAASMLISEGVENLADHILGKMSIQFVADNFESSLSNRTPEKQSKFVIINDNSTATEISDYVMNSVGAIADSLLQACEEAFALVPKEKFTQQKAMKILASLIKKTVSETSVDTLRAISFVRKERRA